MAGATLSGTSSRGTSDVETDPVSVVMVAEQFGGRDSQRAQRAVHRPAQQHRLRTHQKLKSLIPAPRHTESETPGVKPQSVWISPLTGSDGSVSVRITTVECEKLVKFDNVHK